MCSFSWCKLNLCTIYIRCGFEWFAFSLPFMFNKRCESGIISSIFKMEIFAHAVSCRFIHVNFHTVYARIQVEKQLRKRASQILRRKKTFRHLSQTKRTTFVFKVSLCLALVLLCTKFGEDMPNISSDIARKPSCICCHLKINHDLHDLEIQGHEVRTWSLPCPGASVY